MKDDKMLARGALIARVLYWLGIIGTLVVFLVLAVLLATEILYNWPVLLPEGLRDMIDWYMPA